MQSYEFAVNIFLCYAQVVVYFRGHRVIDQGHKVTWLMAVDIVLICITVVQCWITKTWYTLHV